MTAIAILPEPASSRETKYRAISGEHQSLGKTPGEALDLLTPQLGERDSGTLVVVQQMKPDRFFSEAQCRRLGELMGRWRSGRDGGAPLAADEQMELDQLVDLEVQASAQRARFILDEMRP